MKKEDEENSGPCTPRNQICDCFRNCCSWFQCGNYTEHQGLTCAIQITHIYSICVFTEICLWKDKQTVKTQFLSSKTAITWTTFDYPDTQRQLRCHGLACSHLCTYNWPPTITDPPPKLSFTMVLLAAQCSPWRFHTLSHLSHVCRLKQWEGKTLTEANVERRAAGLLNPNLEQSQSVMEAEGC